MVSCFFSPLLHWKQAVEEARNSCGLVKEGEQTIKNPNHITGVHISVGSTGNRARYTNAES